MDRGRPLVLLFMAAVTCHLLATVFALATDGAARLDEAIFYAVAAAFGLEFLWSAWPPLWGRVGETTEH